MKPYHMSGRQCLAMLMLVSMFLLQTGCSCGRNNETETSSQGAGGQENSSQEPGTQDMMPQKPTTQETSTEEIGTSSTDGVNQMTEPEYGSDADAVGGGTADPIYVPGTYTGSAKGYGGQIEVTVEVDETHILSIDATGEMETPTVGQKAIKELAQRIKDANDTDIEGISGATYSSQGLFEAVNDALAQAYTGE